MCVCTEYVAICIMEIILLINSSRVFLFLWQQTPTYALANEVSPIRKCNGNMFTNEARNNYIYKPIIHVTTDKYQRWNALYKCSGRCLISYKQYNI